MGLMEGGSEWPSAYTVGGRPEQHLIQSYPFLPAHSVHVSSRSVEVTPRGMEAAVSSSVPPRLPLLPRTASLQQGRSSKKPQRPSRTLPSPASEGSNSPHQGAASTRRKFAENFQGERIPALPAKSRHLTKEANVLPPSPTRQSKQLSPR